MQTAEGIPCLETLEPRLFLDGTVTMSLVGTIGFIKGDSHNNAITVVQNGADYTVTPSGGTHFKYGGVNYTTAHTAHVPGVTGLVVDLGAGGDILSLGLNKSSSAFNLAGDVSIALGSGVNGLTIYGLACRNLTIDGANGANTINLSSTDTATTTLTGNLTVTGWGTGVNYMGVSGAAIQGSVIMSLGNGSNGTYPRLLRQRQRHARPDHRQQPRRDDRRRQRRG